MCVFVFILVLICICSLKLTCRNYGILTHSIKWCISFILGIEFNFSNSTLPKEILNVIIKNIIEIKKNEKKNFKFVDFGCGRGNILFSMRNLFDKLEGIEIDEKIANEAGNYLSDFSNISIKNINMQHYDYEPINTILYFFEPISIINIKKEKNIYNYVFKNIEKTFKNTNLVFYIIYVTDIFKSTDKNILSGLFKKYNFCLIKKTSCCFRKTYVYKYKN